MRIRTIEDDFDYQMKGIINKLKDDYDLHDLNAEELQDILWKSYAAELGKTILEKCAEYSGDELFE